jgi:hypothetical protein
MEASLLLSGRGLTAQPTVTPASDDARVVAPDGDFAAGCRRRTNALLVRGRFATGMTARRESGEIGTFATGMASVTGYTPGCGDFAAGQRVGSLVG